MISIEETIEDLLPEEKDELLKQIVGLSPQEAKKVIRAYKLKLDLPDLTDEQRQPLPEHLFEEVQEKAIMLIEATEEIVAIDLLGLHPNAKALLFSQIKKSIGMLGRLVSEN